MKKIRESRITKCIAIITIFGILSNIILPTAAYALTSGPKSPEFMSFSPVATTNMVDMATGNFSYNIPVIDIPGANGGGYSLSLAYQSGVTSEQEASWVGFGWSLNPGAINRNKRGFPDEFNGEEINYYNKMKPNWSVSATKRIGMEAFGVDLSNYSKSLRFNNHQGYMSSFGYGLSVMGVGLNMNHDANGYTFSASVNFNASLGIAAKEAVHNATNNPQEEINTLQPIKNQSERCQFDLNRSIKETVSNTVNRTSSFGLYTFSEATKASSFKKYQGYNFNFNHSTQINPAPLPVGLEMGEISNFNMQYNKFKTEAYAYGYLQNRNTTTINPIMDYYVEKSSDYNKRDLFIGMPFSNYDIFSVSGEGVYGGFRAYKEKPGHYVPENGGDGLSKVKIRELGIEFMAGLDVGIGLDIGFGSQKTQLMGWGANNNFGNTHVFRFNNDLGGKIEYGMDNTDLEKADLRLKSKIPGAKTVSLNEHDIFYNEDNSPVSMDSENAGSAAYIDYHTFGQIPNPSYSYTKQLNRSSYYNIGVTGNSIAEYSIYNDEGINYVYGLPVLNRNETYLNIDILPQEHQVVNNYLAFRDVPITNSDNNYEVNDDNLKSPDYKAIVGEIQQVPYVNMFLLSHITSSNYVDINNNGPDEADFGGWTKFNYRRIYGGSSSWYRYRTPYNGLLYQKNTISDDRDDLGSVTTGEKEVYYLEAVETKTHIAFFVTNKFEYQAAKYKGKVYNVGNGSYVDNPINENLRKDGIDAPQPGSSNDNAGTIENLSQGSNDLEKLERIVLFSKNRPEQPIKTIHFEYDYSLVPNLPNNKDANFNYNSSSSNNAENTGKLTLKKVWFEYEGIKSARISPYEFVYNYKNSNSILKGEEYYSEFDDVTNVAQNPPYSPELLDPWGNVMKYGKERKDKLMPWVYQGSDLTYAKDIEPGWRKNAQEDEPYDPAAWQLKQIKLPSGGEIHIQYEQKEYNYVQDKPVMGMASLIASDESEYDHPYYLINVDDLGCDPTNQVAVETFAQNMREFFQTTDDPETAPEYSEDKVYFKFLYDLIKDDPDIDNPNSEYITGYANVRSISSEEYPAGSGNYCIKLFLGQKGAETRERSIVPRQAGYEFLVNQRQGKLNGERNKGKYNYTDLFDSEVEDIANNDLETGEVKGIASKIIDIFNKENILTFTNYKKQDACKSLAPGLSYLKLPMFSSKKGGGIRVKRLLLYDKGIENGDATLLGQQFYYVLSDGVTSSGVATNEPSASREENPLVRYMPRKEQGLYSRLTSGEDRKQTEGPIGESLLPAASITYSRVVVENIHSNKAGAGFTIHEFNTTKDYPFDRNYGETAGLTDANGLGVAMTTLSSEPDVLSIPTGLINFSVDKLWMAQGYRFILNSMNGMAKSVTSYGGNYNSTPEERKSDNDAGYIVQKQDYEYYEPGEKVKLLKWNGVTYDEIMDIPGKEMEINVEKKQIEDNVLDFKVAFDVSFAMFPIVFATGVPSINSSKTLIATHSTTKVIRYPAILKKERFFKDGIMSTTELLAFNKSNGEPAIRKTYDGYSKLRINLGDDIEVGTVYSFNVPAEWMYSSMGAKSQDPDNSSTYTNQLKASAAQINTYGTPPSPTWFTDGTIENVTSINVQTYSTDWGSSWNDSKIDEQYNSSPYSGKLNTIWRAKENYVYKSNDDAVSSYTNKVYNGGYFTVSNMFDWTNGATQPNDWIRVSEITKYSPNGNALEEKNVMGIYSAAMFGKAYGYNMPSIIVQNGQYDDVYFEDYETGEGSMGAYAHSGSFSRLYTSSDPIIEAVYVTPHLKDAGGLLKLWLSFNDKTTEDVDLALTVNGLMTKLKPVARSGKWILYEAKIDKTILPEVSQELYASIEDFPGTDILVDDVRFQPQDAQANCYVYDKETLRLLTQFDDQHFGLYYQYNNEGQLTHKIIETERGKQTIQETQYHLPKTNR